MRRFRWILTPLLAFIALAAWAVASPIGAGPDDDYHLVSIWCANGGSEHCVPGEEEGSRLLPPGFTGVACFAQDPELSAACQDRNVSDDALEETERGNFAGEYPPVYYSVMRIFAGQDLQSSAVTMRLFNAALFVGLATALAALLAPLRRSTLLWGWLITTVPLGMFLIASNNPSGWAITGVGTAFLALLGWFEATGRRRWALGALYLVGVIMAAGSRGDAAVYVAGATAAVLILTAVRKREWALGAILPAVGLLVAFLFFAAAGQSGVASSGFTSDGTSGLPGGDAGVEGALSGFALAAYNLLMLPFLWTGVWGTWALGWLDTAMPAIVPWAATAAFIVVAFAGLGLMNWRKAIAVSGVLTVLVALPVYVLTAGGDKVGANLQPRYLLPLIVLFAFLLATRVDHRRLTFTRVQLIAILGALAVAQLIALQVNIRRYVTGAEHQGLNLNAGAEWWWEGLPVGPTAVWVIGSLAYVGVLALLWPLLRGRVALTQTQA